jgi:hypothetical protein
MHRGKIPSARVVADSPLAQKTRKNCPTNQRVAAPENAKNRQNEKGRQLRWEAVNAVTWRLTDPAGPRIEVPRSPGRWPGFFTPRALAWVFDVGLEKPDWRGRIRKRGGWCALGRIVDLETAKRLALAAVECGAP